MKLGKMLENQNIEFEDIQFHDVIKCLSTKQEIHFSKNQSVKEIWSVILRTHQKILQKPQSKN